MHDRIPALSLCLLLAACGGAKDAASRQAAMDTTATHPMTPARVASVDGFSTPESVIYDPDQDVWFVTNINGGPSEKDNNGFISRLKPDGTIDSLKFIAGGRDGVTLNAPKGQAIVGDTLWVADIDAVRGFNRKTGAPVATVAFGTKARFLNDVAVGPDGALYVTDTGIIIDAKGIQHPGPDRIFRVGPDHAVTVKAEGDSLLGPNGIAWDAMHNRFVVVPFGGTALLTWVPDSTPASFATGPGQQDGVVVLPDGRVLVSSWADSTIFVASPSGRTALIKGVAAPADIGLDTKRAHLAVPLFTQNRVEIWTVPAQ